MTPAQPRALTWWSNPVSWLRIYFDEKRRAELIRIEKEITAKRAYPEIVPPAAPAAKPRRKGLGPKQIKWLRANCQPFKDMEARAKASKLVGSKAP